MRFRRKAQDEPVDDELVYYIDGLGEDEEEEADPNAGPLKEHPEQADRELNRIGWETWVGMAISSNLASSVMKQLQTNGVVKRGYLGIEGARELSTAAAERYGLKNGHGVLVARVFPNSPASMSMRTEARVAE